MANGAMHLYIQFKEFYNNYSIGAIGSNARVHFPYPKLGKPFSNEFNKKPCEKVEYSEDGIANIYRAFYSSDKYKGITFEIVHKIYPNGLVQRWFEFENSGLKDVKDLVIKDNFNLGFKHLEMPYNGKILEVEDDVFGGMANWDANKLSENWLFTKNVDSTVGVFWGEGDKIQFGAWEKFFEYDLSGLKIGERLVTKPLTMAFDMFNNSHNFRQFALGKLVKELPKHRDLLFDVNEGNPFVNEKYQVKVIEQKKEIRMG